jgi:predicted DNA-binding transcriptional regulator
MDSNHDKVIQSKRKRKNIRSISRRLSSDDEPVAKRQRKSLGGRLFSLLLLGHFHLLSQVVTRGLLQHKLIRQVEIQSLIAATPKPELRTNIEDRLKVALTKLKQKREENSRGRGMSL